MENIVTVENYDSYYVDNEVWTPCFNKKSTTPMYGILNIDHRTYQCMPSGFNNMCDGCAFYEDTTYDAMCMNLPCAAKHRIDNRDCIYIEVFDDNALEEKKIYTTKDFEKLKTYRFK